MHRDVPCSRGTLFRAAQGNGNSLRPQQTTRAGQSCRAGTLRSDKLYCRSPSLMSSAHHCNGTSQAEPAVQPSS